MKTRSYGIGTLAPVVALGLAVGLAVLPDTLAHHPLVAVVKPLASVVVLVGAVFAAVHQAEIIAIRLGEPYGTLVLTIAVTIIEVSLVVSMMLNGANNPTLARDSVLAVVMIVCTGLVGVCLLLGGMRYKEQEIRQQATSAYLSVLIALSVLMLLMPNVTTSTVEGTLSPFQLAFLSGASLLLYAGFLYIQTVRHRGFFLDVGAEEAAHGHGEPPGNRRFMSAVALLLCALVGVVLLAEHVAEGVENTVAAAGLARGDAVVGALVAMLVLMPEGIGAIRAASRNNLQTSLNVALGSALATIGLTIPSVGVASLYTGREVVLGVSPREGILMMLTLLICVVSFGSGRTNVLNGLVHITIFAAFLLFLFVP
jgi:Ca2+:H+ antiporter